MNTTARQAFEQALEQTREAVAPDGWEKTVKKMKKHPEIDNPWALAWWMKGQGHTPGGKQAGETMNARTTFEDALIATRIATRFAMEHSSPEALKEYLKEHPGADRSNHSVNKKDEGPNPNRVSGGEVSGHLELVTKGLELHPTTWKALSKFRGDLKKENVTTKDVKELVEDLEFAKGQVKDPTKPKGKKTVDKIENVLKFLGGLEKKSPHLFGK